MIESEIAQAQEFAVSVAWEAGTLLRERFDGPRDVDHKGVIDLVTDADRRRNPRAVPRAPFAGRRGVDRRDRPRRLALGG